MNEISSLDTNLVCALVRNGIEAITRSDYASGIKADGARNTALDRFFRGAKFERITVTERNYKLTLTGFVNGKRYSRQTFDCI